MITFKSTILSKSCGAVVALALSTAPILAQTAGQVPPGPGSDAAKPPAYVPQGPPPSANDPVPAPAAPEHNAGEPMGASADTVTPPGSTAPGKWTTDQILTATVHQAWILAGKNEDTFFQIVKQLAEISAENRGMVLPDTPAAGRKAGQYIRTHAKADHDALLYAIVDKAVQMTGTPETAHTTATRASHAGSPDQNATH